MFLEPIPCAGAVITRDDVVSAVAPRCIGDFGDNKTQVCVAVKNIVATDRVNQVPEVAQVGQYADSALRALSARFRHAIQHCLL